VWWSSWTAGALGSALLLAAGAAPAQPAPAPAPGQGAPIPVNVMVTHLSNEEGGVDAQARDLERQLSEQGMRFKRIEVLDKRRVNLAQGEVSIVPLPDGKTARLSPVLKDENGVLIAVDVEGAVKTDVRVRNGHTVVIGGPRYRGGKIAISIEPDY